MISRALGRLGELVRYGGDPELAQYVYTLGREPGRGRARGRRG